jgi:flagellar biosynthesis protein FlhG
LIDEERPSLPPYTPPALIGETPSLVRPRIIAIAGAKGGVGSTVLAANLGLYLASIGRKVVLCDADVGGANLHTLAGLRAPAYGKPVETAVPEMRILALRTALGPKAARQLQAAGALPSARRASKTAANAEVRALDADYAVVDLGGGGGRYAIESFLAAPLPLLLTLPEPTALERTWRFVSRAFLHWLKATIPDVEARTAVLARARAMGGLPTPLDLWRVLEDEGDPRADVVRERMEAFHPPVVLNQTRLRADLELGAAMRSAAHRRLGISIEYLGHIEYDDTVWTCVRSQKLLLIESPGTKASKNIEKIARRLLTLESGKRRPWVRTVPPESHHDLLEVERGATDEDVRRAYKRAKDVYDQRSIAAYGLFTREELKSLSSRLDEAFDVLLDPSRRKPYELSIFPPEPHVALARPERSLDSDPLPVAPDIDPDTDFTGDILRQVRESQGLRIEDIAQRTKVGSNYLVAIEAEDFGALPAAVYVRGFVVEVAKYLKLDSTHVARTYVRRYRRYLDERERA